MRLAVTNATDCAQVIVRAAHRSRQRRVIRAVSARSRFRRRGPFAATNRLREPTKSRDLSGFTSAVTCTMFVANGRAILARVCVGWAASLRGRVREWQVFARSSSEAATHATTEKRTEVGSQMRSGRAPNALFSGDSPARGALFRASKPNCRANTCRSRPGIANSHQLRNLSICGIRRCHEQTRLDWAT